MVASRLTERARVLRLRSLLGLTQRELASDFGVASGAVAQWESGKRRMPGPALKLLGFYEAELGLTDAASREGSLVPVGESCRRRGSLEALALLSVYRYLAANADRTSFAGHVQDKVLERYVMTAGRLRGLSMKLLQMASFIDMVVDEGERCTLAAAKARISAMPEPTVNAVFLRAFGKTPEKLFASWHAHPFEVTSLGQVHDARLVDGRRVVVKVQHPLMARALKADLASIDYLDRLYVMAARGQSRGVIFAEIRDRILEECDYILEARRQTEFGELFAGRADIHVPRVVPELSAGTILSTERADGLSLDDFAAHGSSSARNRASSAIWTFFMESAHRHGIFNADVHPGNFLFHADGSVSFLDFGRVKRCSEAFRKQQRELARALLERNQAAFGRALDASGATRGGGIEYDAAYRAFSYASLPILREGPFTFSPEFVRRVWRMWTRNPNRSRFDMSSDHVFLEPVLLGRSAIHARLGAVIECRSQMLDLLYSSGEARPRPHTVAEIAELERFADAP